MISWRVKAEDGGWAFRLQLEGGDHVELVQSGVCQDRLQNTRVQPLAGRWEKVKDWGEREDKDNQWKFNLRTNVVFVSVLFCCFRGGTIFTVSYEVSWYYNHFSTLSNLPNRTVAMDQISGLTSEKMGFVCGCRLKWHIHKYWDLQSINELFWTSSLKNNSIYPKDTHDFFLCLLCPYFYCTDIIVARYVKTYLFGIIFCIIVTPGSQERMIGPSEIF